MHRRFRSHIYIYAYINEAYWGDEGLPEPEGWERVKGTETVENNAEEEGGLE